MGSIIHYTWAHIGPTIPHMYDILDPNLQFVYVRTLPYNIFKLTSTNHIVVGEAPSKLPGAEGMTDLFDVTLRSAKKENGVVSSCCGCNGSQPNPWKLLKWNRVEGNGSNQRTILLCLSTIARVQIQSLQTRTRQ